MPIQQPTLLFLPVMVDLILRLYVVIRLFADDTTLYMIVENPLTTAEVLNSDTGYISV